MKNTRTGANQPALRSHNTALVLDLLRTAGPAGLSRPELAERTGLTPQAVSKITARLRTEGLAADAGQRASTGGKPATALRLVPEAGHAVGVHLDRDQLTAVLVDLAGMVVGVRQAPLDLGAPAEVVLGAIEEAVRGVTGSVGVGGARRGPAQGGSRRPAQGRSQGGSPAAAPLGVGVAMPGPLDHAAGVPHRVTGHPQWDGYPLRDELARRLGGVVVLDKDTNAAALGLALRAGAPESFAYLHLGTGLGAALILGGAPYRGARTGAGEFGHQTVQLDGPPCGCGGRGCLEVLCLGAVERGDVAEAARVLGTGAANLVALLDVDRVVLGGRIVEAEPEAFVRGVGEVLRALARRRTGAGPGAPVPVGVAGSVYAVAEGAAQLVLAPVFGKGGGEGVGEGLGEGRGEGVGQGVGEGLGYDVGGDGRDGSALI
ncbi:ROK family protein [Streptomyces sp. NPDC048604]|uniref:ROK family transcriptional regulator n=1 Tax=Streptomyces sp. NPDC048604 TaxID=3365578 RepID=UPI0037219FB9